MSEHREGYSFINMQDVLGGRDPDKAIDRVGQAIDHELERCKDELAREFYGAKDDAHLQRAFKLLREWKRQEMHQEFVLRSVC